MKLSLRIASLLLTVSSVPPAPPKAVRMKSGRASTKSSRSGLGPTAWGKRK